MTIQATPVLPGKANGPVLRLSTPISFWGGVDPKTGQITDLGSEAVGTSIAGKILVLPRTRGSSSGSAVLLQLLHAGLAPAAIILGEIDAILGLGILVAKEMGWLTIPLLTLPQQDQQELATAKTVVIEEDGQIIS